MKLQRAPGRQFGLVFFIPAVGVAAALMVFFLFNGPFLLQPGIAVSVPESTFLLSPQHDPQVVSVTAPPAAAIYFDNRKVTIEEFQTRLADAAVQNRTIVIKADRLAPLELVVETSETAISLGYSVVLATSEPQ